ncbi:cytoplasmic polyadenylation element-binding protein 1 isoform X2 [Cylas formicarius]|nr:cytoplasmic polyadenylation element-binding protein 1 isoform X2 [Cylas formicarius]XP_060524783.1 cytoplasmic polyadenylation element-binding protein 1 isoform X2 [Cylas formicarius]
MLPTILQKHSINSLLDKHMLPEMRGEQREATSVADLFGLNSPRGLLNFGNSQWSPGSPQSVQLNGDDMKFQTGTLNYANAPPGFKNLERNPLGSAGSSPVTPPAFRSRALRGTSLSDSYGSNSPAVLDSPFVSNTSESEFGGHQDVNLSDLLNSLTLNDSTPRNSSGGCDDHDASNPQNLQTLNALMWLQQQPPALLNSLLFAASGQNGGGGVQSLDKWNNNTSVFNSQSESFQLDCAARFHRCAASVYDAMCTWSGNLPFRTDKPNGFSCKVFLGGVPWDISEQCLVQTFKPFGPIKVEWPGKERDASQPRGYVYIIFESEKSVKALLQSSTMQGGNWYFKLGSKRLKYKDVQVIPWCLNEANYTKSASQKLDPSKTVFVGALHGMINAQGLAKVMNDLFDGVVYAGIDTDKYRYPIGSGRVMFNNYRSYMRAVSAAFVEIRTTKFTKKVQIDPYLEDSLCTVCGVQQGPYFCRDLHCYRYFCRSCWNWQHCLELRHHTPMSRNSKNKRVGNFSMN